MTTSGEEQAARAGRQALLDMLRGYRTAQVLIACAEVGVFDALAGGRQTAAALAGTTGADGRSVERLLNAAVALGLVEKNGRDYALAPRFEASLAPGGRFYLGNYIRRENAFYSRWGRLAEAIKTGRRPEENARDEGGPDWVRRFELALYDLARAIGPLVAEALALPAGRPVQVLDVGGGHGGYSLALAQRYPNLTATVYELPRVVPVAREFIAAAGLAERVRVQAGDFHRDPLGEGYDLVLLFGVLTGDDSAGRQALLRSAHSALRPGGQVVIREFLLEPDRTGPAEAALFELQMLLSTGSGGLTTREELSAWLQAAGFEAPEALALPAWANSDLVLARKP